MAPCKKRDLPTEWTLWCEEDEERARERQRDEGRVQEAGSASNQGGITTSPQDANWKKNSEATGYFYSSQASG
jgi:hypothetical protein